ncbi:putative anthranilate synthase component I TrpE2/ Salicylate synthase MbtI [Pilimelia anulata]|uniref:Putative anthranilate synthase component I TrpE2/ Salicylate synthase MbtI n=1 Tax=Pilimelia anulata TaxID=53371 RepID=A0A8J3BEE9_9ACTN|nr:salicylate synthase [Pilimelia anulata]GGK04526.1 putative anthranilate synthase component I TrpE2/ Salicylate synthase MbtI [Pilimelia anulata]
MRYHELRVPGRFDPIVLAARLASCGLFEGYVVYERGGEWWFAGDRLVDVVVDGESVRVTADGTTSAQPWTGEPLSRVNAALAGSGVSGWRAFGWAGFELAYAIAGRRDLVGEQDLLHLFIPRTEVRLADGEVLVRSVDEDRLGAVRELLRAPEAPAAAPAAAPVDIADGRAEYEAGVAKVVADIRDGLLQKVILSRAVDVPFDVDLVSTYVLGRQRNTPARSFLLDLGGWQAAGFSPETVAEVSADGRVLTQPLAGTRAYGDDPAADADRRATLYTDPKEVFEHAASVKLACEEMSAFCAAGSVSVGEFMVVKERGSVQHLGSRVNGVLDRGRSAFDALAVLFPAVTASGIPKLPAYDRIVGLEDRPRDLYAGAVLMAAADGSLDAALVLRAIYRRDGRTWLRAGAGIVADSTPEREYEETCEKLGSVAPHVVRRSRELAELAAG